MRELTSTIAAISTPPGKGGVAIIRISGEDALKIAERVFTPRGARALRDNPRRMIFGSFSDRGEIIDDGMAVYFAAPASFTGEDMVELNCHGGILVSAAVLEAVLTAGAVPAAAGEFTRRAFIGGKLTLNEAESIGLLLDAKSKGQLRLSSYKSRSRLACELSKIRSELVGILSSMYARIDYPDEDLGDFSDEECLAQLSSSRERISGLISTYKTGRAVKDGIDTVICGLPNAGKSTLYNALSGDEYAIVTDIPGTTRDILERDVPIGNLLLCLADTAGIREGDISEVEKIGIDRSLSKINSSSLVIALFDSTSDISCEEIELINKVKAADGAKIALLTKCKGSHSYIYKKEEMLREHFADVIRISAKESPDEVRSLLEPTINHLFTDGEISVGEDAIIYEARHNSILIRAKEALDSAISALLSGYPQDIASSDIEAALTAVAELDGSAVSEAIVADIFAKFCVGK